MDGRQPVFGERIGGNHGRVIFRVFLAFLLGVPLAVVGEIPFAERQSGYEFMSRETRAMQNDDATNPGMLWLLDGEDSWKRKTGAAGKACADCHGEAEKSMKGVAARYPAMHAGKLVNLDQRINACRVEQQKAPALQLEGRELLSLSAYIGRQSRGLPIEIAINK